jgi:NAD(P)-dependent dehydrogenase (short-subunit alcohol dehydrogenase family)
MTRQRYDNYDRVAVVTGSDSGIGEAIAVALADSGFDVGVTYHSDKAGAEGAAAKVAAAGRRCEIRQLDLDRLAEAAAVVDELADALGGLGVLVNDAGTGISTPVVDTSYDDWRHVLAVDLDGPFLCAQRAARRMRAAGRGGRIINITSVHEHAPRAGSGAYCAAKGGLGLLTKVMARSWAATA